MPAKVCLLVANHSGWHAVRDRRWALGSGPRLLRDHLGFKARIEQKRWAAVIHALAAVLAIAIWIIHVYAAIWVRGDGQRHHTRLRHGRWVGAITASGCAKK
jgi:cytochrome b subunit of formate dehydrogenase